MLNKTIDINVDVGEGLDNESLIMPYISSCNIACGGHAGDLESMNKVVKLAKQNHVKIGVHPSFPDKENFGRVFVHMPRTFLFESIKNQIEALSRIADQEKVSLHHVKPHGALYNYAAKDESVAKLIVEVFTSLKLEAKLYVPYNSVIEDLAIKANIKIVYEAFADRNYNDDLTLVSRGKSNAVLHDSDTVFEHVFRMISEQKVKTISGREISLKAETFCLHGDNPNVIDLIKNLKQKLEVKGVLIC